VGSVRKISRFDRVVAVDIAIVADVTIDDASRKD
jgi:hypothetical protein